jgi:predicted ATPase
LNALTFEKMHSKMMCESNDRRDDAMGDAQMGVLDQSSSVSVPIKGNRGYTDMLGLIAKKRGFSSVAQLVRDAVDQAHGEELVKLASFFDESVASKQQEVTSGNDALAVAS